MILYANGAHAAYSHNFVSRRSAGARGGRITGYLGTLRFDFCTETIRLIEHHGIAVEDIKVQAPDGHQGGDSALARNFVAVRRGSDTSRCTLRDGLLSAATCLAARSSEASGRIEPVTAPWQAKSHVVAPGVQVSLGVCH